MRINLSRVTNDERLQRRVKGLDSDRVQTMAELLADDPTFDLPPVAAVSEGNEFHFWDGWHRIEAYRTAKRKDIPATVTKGTWRDAWKESFRANGTHGLPRTKADIEAMMKAAFEDEEIGAMSDREIARTVGLNHGTVSRWREKLSVARATDAPPTRSVTRNGTTYPMNTGAIGGTKPDAAPSTNGKHTNNGKANPDADDVPTVPKVSPMDALGNPIPKGLRDTFAGNTQALENAVRLLQEVKRTAKGLQAWNAWVRPSELEERLKDLIEDFKNGMPYAVCEPCKGKGCSACRKEGWLTKWAHAEIEA